MTIPRDQIAKAYIDACVAELGAPKPGNVHVFAGGHDMEAAHFLAADIKEGCRHIDHALTEFDPFFVMLTRRSPHPRLPHICFLEFSSCLGALTGL